MTSEHRRAKIMATLGPASRDEAVLRRLLDAGLDIVRLNLSHGDHDTHRELIRRVRRLSAEHRRPIPIVLDLMGPRYRVSALEKPLTLVEGSTVRLAREGHGSPSDDLTLPVEDSVLEHLREDERVLIDDGLVELRVRERSGDEAVAEVIFGGRVSSRKGINLPDTDLPFEVSEKDERDIRFAVEEGLDYIAASYVGAPEDVQAIRDRVRDAGGDLPIIAKLERGRAVECLEDMVEAADALMVARGDLGVEVPMPRVPVLQKLIVSAGRRAGKPVIVATQMLESMTEQPRPTRAEATDVANAVFDGADALMLSGETAAGKYPVESVTTMDRVIREAEAHQRRNPSSKALLFPLETARVSEVHREGNRSAPQQANPDRLAGRESFALADVVCSAAVYATGRADFRWIISFSQGGFTARIIARYRPAAPILVFTPREEVARRVQLFWGVRPLVLDVDVTHHDEVVEVVEEELRRRELADTGDTILLLQGDPIPERPLTNLLRVHRLGGPLHPQPEV